MTNNEAIKWLREAEILDLASGNTKDREALKLAISALQAQEEKTQLSREDTTSGVQKTCITCKHYPPESKWPCIDCDMRNPADRWEPQELSKNSPKLDKENGDLQPTCNQLAKDICVPCKDTISRQAAIDAIVDWAESHHENPDGDDCIMIILDVPSAQPEPQWIPVSERLPEPRVDVWVNSDIGQIQGYYEEHIGIWYASFGQGRDYLELIVTAWMPLPEPYRAERRTDDQSK